MKIGVIDLGSNTIRLVIYHWDGEKLIKLHNIKRSAQSIKFIHNGIMDPDGFDVITQTLKELIMISRVYETETLKIFATASLRNIENRDEAKRILEQNIQMPIDILEGIEESLFGFEGVKRTAQLPSEGISIDIGGGSTEITYFKNKVPKHGVSIPIGSLNLSLKYVSNVLPSLSEEKQMRQVISDQLKAIDWLLDLHVSNVIGIGGTARAIMKLHQASQGLDASIYKFSVSDDIVHDFTATALKDTLNFSKLILQVIPDRLHTVIPGSLILDEIMQMVKAKKMNVSFYGLREGYLFSRVLIPLGYHE